MIFEDSYRKAFFAALFFHVCLAVLLFIDPKVSQSSLAEAKNEPQSMPIQQQQAAKDEVVQAVSIDNQEVMETVNRLKEARANQLKAEQARQQALVKQAESAKRARLQEQQQLAKLKEEAEKIAIAKKKQIEEEKKHLKQLAEQKAAEAKKLEELKAKQEQLQKKQKEEADKLALLKQKQAEEKLKNDKLKAEQARAEAAKAAQAKAELDEKNRLAAAQQAAAADAAKQAFISSEIDKYKTLIVNAISRKWILPENIGDGLYCQFRIRLAPDGAVMEVDLLRGSGNSVLDNSARTAIFKASPLPVPKDPDTFEKFRDISLKVRPENVRG